MSSAPPPPAELDIIDILAGTASTPAKKALPPTVEMTVAGPNTISLVVSAVEKERAQVFLKRVKDYLEKDPGRLIL